MNRLRALIPGFLRRRLRRPYYFLAYMLSDLRTPRNQTMPFRSAVFVGEGDFAEVGQRFVKHFQTLGSLCPTDRVLDIGCGIGRMAVPLTTYLDQGSYEGFDVVKHGIAWCQKRIGMRHRNFHFTFVDIYNKKYNPRGKLSPAMFRFPYPAESFDFVFATSVFTHMTPRDVAHYLAEIVRVLRPGGTAFVTYFLLNERSLSLLSTGHAGLDFKHVEGGFLTIDPKEPEAAIALHEADVRGMYEQLGLEVREPVHYGSWSGRADSLDYQDIIVAERRKP